MKKVMIAMMIFICVSSLAQDTVFSLYSGKKEPVKIMFPKNVYNSEASLDQNIQAWYYHQRPVLSKKKEVNYSLFIRTVSPISKILEFDGSKNVVKEIKGKALSFFAWELIVIFLITFVSMTLLQKYVQKKNFQNTRFLSYFLILLALCCTALFAHKSMQPIALGFWIVVFLYALSFHTTEEEYSINKKRNFFLILNIPLLGILIFFFLSNYFFVYIFYAAGLILGLPTIYYWRKRAIKLRRRKKTIESLTKN